MVQEDVDSRLNYILYVIEHSNDKNHTTTLDLPLTNIDKNYSYPPTPTPKV